MTCGRQDGIGDYFLRRMGRPCRLPDQKRDPAPLTTAAMTQKTFEELIIRLEAYARRQPAAYKLEVACLAIVGYAYFVIMVGVLYVVFGLACMALADRRSALIVQAAVLALAVVWTLLWWSRIDFHPPQGYSLLRS